MADELCCDKCGEIIKIVDDETLVICQSISPTGLNTKSFHNLCPKCYKKFLKWVEKKNNKNKTTP